MPILRLNPQRDPRDNAGRRPDLFSRVNSCSSAYDPAQPFSRPAIPAAGAIHFNCTAQGFFKVSGAPSWEEDRVSWGVVGCLSGPSRGGHVMGEEKFDDGLVSRRVALRLGAAGAAGVALGTAGGVGGPSLARRGLLSADGTFAAAGTALADTFFYIEVSPTSPLILHPFIDKLPTPQAMAPVPSSVVKAWPLPPGRGVGQQNGSDGRYGTGFDALRNETHQLWTSDIGFPDPIVYQIKLQV